MRGDTELGAKSPVFFIDLFLYSELIIENTNVGEIILTDFLAQWLCSKYFSVQNAREISPPVLDE